jgi:phage FluMu gp28-like protein
MIAPLSPSDIMAGDLLAALDPVVFARHAGVEPEAWQETVLRSPAKQQILCCSRQAGKSTVSAVAAMHQAVYVPGSLILLLAPVGRQSKELLAKIREVFAEASPDEQPSTDNQVEFRLDNGSRVVVIPDKEGNIRGFSAVDLVIIDESAWVRDKTYMAVRPMLAVSQGRIMLLSTPNGKLGFFYDVWANGGDAWHRTMVTAYDVPHLSREWLDDERRTTPRSIFEREYLCVFGDAVDSVFATADIEAALTDDIPSLFPIGEEA